MNPIVCMTGLSGAGKSTIAERVARLVRCEVLDGDRVRRTISRGLGFSPADRAEHLRRTAHLAVALAAHVPVIVACIAPTEQVRDLIAKIAAERGRLIWVKASLTTCEARDVKGLYARARAGEIADFTGVSAGFDEPRNPDLVLDTERRTPDDCALELARYLQGEPVRWQLYVGRWQPLHNGHVAIIRYALERGERVLVGVRETPLSESDPYGAPQRIDMIERTFAAEVAAGRLRAIPVPDLAGVNIGRNVGYEVNTIQVPDDIAAVSGTELRRRMAEGGDWRALVPDGTAAVLTREGLA